MSEARVRFPEWTRKFRWLWFAIGLIGLLQTPFAVMDAVDLVRSDHRLVFVPFVAFPIRLGMIGLFFWLWWATRRLNAEQEVSPKNSN